jgi:hypothetical protein
MIESTCAHCNIQAESKWRIDLEKENGSTTERTQYRLCQGCWEDLCSQFTGSTP